MTTTTMDRATTVQLVLRDALNMRAQDLRNSNSAYARVGKAARGTCTACGRKLYRGERIVVADYATVAFCRTVYEHVAECAPCALEAVLSDETGWACRTGNLISEAR